MHTYYFIIKINMQLMINYNYLLFTPNEFYDYT